MEKATLKDAQYVENKKILLNTLCQNSTCKYCNSIMTRKPNQMSQVTIDHNVPRSLGGQHNMENLITACCFCNSRKSSKMNISFFRLKKSRILTNEEYANLATYLECYNKLNAVKSIEKMVKEDSLEDAILMLEQHKDIGVSARIFNNLVKFINETVRKVKSIVVQIKMIIQRINDLMLVLGRQFQQAQKRVKNISFDVYEYSVN